MTLIPGANSVDPTKTGKDPLKSKQQFSMWVDPQTVDYTRLYVVFKAQMSFRALGRTVGMFDIGMTSSVSAIAADFDVKVRRNKHVIPVGGPIAIALSKISRPVDYDRNLRFYQALLVRTIDPIIEFEVSVQTKDEFSSTDRATIDITSVVSLYNTVLTYLGYGQALPV